MTMPNTHEVLRSIAPRSRTWSGPRETALCMRMGKWVGESASALDSTYNCPRSFKTPLNSYKCRFGGSHSNVPLKLCKSLVSSRRAVAGTAWRIFKFVSPSKLAVSMKDIDCGSLDDSIIRSAGKNVLFMILTMSPTKRSCHLMATHEPFRSVSTSRWLISSSARCRFCVQTTKVII